VLVAFRRPAVSATGDPPTHIWCRHFSNPNFLDLFKYKLIIGSIVELRGAPLFGLQSCEPPQVFPCFQGKAEAEQQGGEGNGTMGQSGTKSCIEKSDSVGIEQAYCCNG
jgi:hypothetical protein